MFGDRYSSSTSCSRWLHETEPARLDQSRSYRFLKVATQPARVTEGARGHRDASPARGLARVSSAASPAARHPTSVTTRETHRASPRTPPATGPARSGTHAACGAPRRHTMPSAQAVVKRAGGAGRTSVSQSWKVTGHFVRLYLRPRCQAVGTIGEFFRKMARPAGFEPATLGLVMMERPAPIRSA